MPIKLPSPPRAAMGILKQGLASFGSHLAIGGGAFDELQPDAQYSFRVSDPHQVFSVGLSDVYRGLLVTTAKPTGWRYLLFDAGGIVGTAEIHGSDDDLRFGRVSRERDPFADGTLAALEHAAEESTGDDAEFRLLKIPALTVLCAWLHGALERFIPIAPVPADLKPDRVYDEKTLAASLHDRAGVLLKFDENTAPPDDLRQA